MRVSYFELILRLAQIFLSTFFFFHFLIKNSTQTLRFFFFNFFYYKNANIFIFNENKKGKEVYLFFIFKLTFLDTKIENLVQITRSN